MATNGVSYYTSSEQNNVINIPYWKEDQDNEEITMS